MTIKTIKANVWHSKFARGATRRKPCEIDWFFIMSSYLQRLPTRNTWLYKYGRKPNYQWDLSRSACYFGTLNSALGSPAWTCKGIAMAFNLTINCKVRDSVILTLVCLYFGFCVTNIKLVATKYGSGIALYGACKMWLLPGRKKSELQKLDYFLYTTNYLGPKIG